MEPIKSSTPGPINRIAYVTPQGQLQTIAPTGADQRTLTDTDLTYQFPAWSPDGGHLAAIGGDGHGTGVFTCADRPYPSEPQTFYFSTDQLPFYLYWAPNSRLISFIATHPRSGIGLHLASLTEEGSHLLATGQPLFWNWLPESDRLLIHSGVNRPEARLALVEVKHGHMGENLARPGLFQAPGIAPSGRFWAYGEIDEGDHSRLVIEEIGRQERFKLLHEGALALGWDPTGDRLAYIAPPTPVQRFYGPLHIIDTLQCRTQLLIQSTVLAFFWAPTGRHIAYFTLADRPYRAGREEGGAPVNGTENKAYPSNGRAANQRQPGRPTLRLSLAVVDVATGLSHQLLEFEPPPLFINQFLPFFDQYALSHRLWSPDGQALVLPVVQEGETEITVVPLQGQPRPIAAGQIAFWSQQ